MYRFLLLVVTTALTFPAAPAAEPYWAGQLELPRAWQLSEGADVRVGLIDTGVATDPDLAGAMLPGADFPDVGAPAGDAIGHGTTMALLIAGRGIGGGTHGVAPRARILPARLTGGAEDAVAAVRWAVDQGAKVVNISLGAGHSGETGYDPALAYAKEHDVVVVAAAGNVGEDSEVTSPADRPGVLAVSAVDGSGRFRDDVGVSGPAISFAAPGVDISTSRPGERAPTSGTSQATAIVSGVVALVRARYPELSAGEVTDQLARTAKDLGAPGRDDRYGFGLIDPLAALSVAPPSSGVPWWAVALGIVAGIAVVAGGAVVVRRRRRAARG
jgi:serine protease